MPEDVLDRALECIADGLPVDWQQLEHEGSTGNWVGHLRVLHDIAHVHRTAATDLQTTVLSSAPVAPSVAVGTGLTGAWGRYRLDRPVGEGGFGSVYRAWDPELERDVAIKFLHQRVDAPQRERLLAEGRALAKVRHENVVTVYGIEANDDRAGLCMEFVGGQTLDDIVRVRGLMSLRDAVRVGQDLCRALEAVHRAGYVHRDVKARNVMHEDSGRIVLMDFGLGRISAHEVGDRAGTPAYMPPEVLEGEPATQAGDVYSLGVVLYYLVTRRYPVEARTLDELRTAHRLRRHQWLGDRRPDLPLAFVQVVERAIAVDPRERYASAGDLHADLAALRVGAPGRFGRLLRPVGAVATLLLGIFLSGALTSAAFNRTLQRSEFAEDTLWDYFVFGRRASVSMLVLLLAAVLAVTGLRGLARLMRASIPGLRALDDSSRGAASRIVHRLHLDEVNTRASYALVVSLAAVTATVWYFAPLILAMMTQASYAATETLSLLAPESVAYHNRYRQAFILVAILTAAAWYPTLPLLRKGQSIQWALATGGVAIFCASLLLLQAPYRLLYFSDGFYVVDWKGERCYELGERGAARLLFCPGLMPPRNRVVDADEVVRRQGETGSLFSAFGREFSKSDGGAYR